MTQDTLTKSPHRTPPPAQAQTADTYQQLVGQTHPELVSSQVKMKVSHTDRQGGKVM